jgi:hypothetical protein
MFGWPEVAFGEVWSILAPLVAMKASYRLPQLLSLAVEFWGMIASFIIHDPDGLECRLVSA